MIHIKNLIYNIGKKEYRKLYKNLILISLGQIITTIAALILLPYLTRVLGPEKWGLISLGERSTLLFGFLIDFGLSTISNKKMAVNIDDLEEKKEIFSQTIYTRSLFGIICTIIFIFLLLFVEMFFMNKLVFILFFLSSLFNYILHQEHVFKSHEKMIYNSIVTSINRTLYLILIIFFVNSSHDYQIVALIFFISYFISVMSSLMIALYKFNLSFKKFNLIRIKECIKQGSNIFVVKISENLYRTSNIFFFGLLINNILVGYLNVSFSIILIILNLIFFQIVNVTFPHMNKILLKDRKAAFKFFKNILVLIIILGIICAFLLIIFAEPIILIIAGKEYYESILILQILAFLPLIIGTSNAIAFLLLIPLNRSKKVSQVNLFILLFFLAFEFIFIPQLGLNGHCLILIFSEILVLTLFLIMIKRNSIFSS